MKKIYLVESLGFVAIKLQQLVKSNLKDVEFTVTDGKLLDVTNSDYVFGNADLIILDLDKSRQNLNDFVVSLKKSSITAHIPVLVISSNADYKTLRDAIGAGCQDFLLKPFSDSTLINKINKWLYKEASPMEAYKKSYSKEAELEANVQMVWNDAFKTGIEEIDIEHKKIVDSYERLYGLMKEGKGHAYYEELISFLESYVKDHFEHEEAFQKRINYSGYEEHRELHRLFKLKVQTILDSHNSKDVSNLDLINISVFIKDLLLHHILIEDLKLSTYYNENISK